MMSVGCGGLQNKSPNHQKRCHYWRLQEKAHHRLWWVSPISLLLPFLHLSMRSMRRIWMLHFMVVRIKWVEQWFRSLNTIRSHIMGAANALGKMGSKTSNYHFIWYTKSQSTVSSVVYCKMPKWNTDWWSSISYLSVWNSGGGEVLKSFHESYSDFIATSVLSRGNDAVEILNERTRKFVFKLAPGRKSLR